MVEKFNPAPLDKHPEDPKEAAKADREMDGNFMAGLVGTFPASDPVSATQPGTRTGSPNPLWIRWWGRTLIALLRARRAGKDRSLRHPDDERWGRRSPRSELLR
jgi:hypothetical protein